MLCSSLTEWVAFSLMVPLVCSVYNYLVHICTETLRWNGTTLLFSVLLLLPTDKSFAVSFFAISGTITFEWHDGLITRLGLIAILKKLCNALCHILEWPEIIMHQVIMICDAFQQPLDQTGTLLPVRRYYSIWVNTKHIRHLMAQSCGLLLGWLHGGKLLSHDKQLSTLDSNLLKPDCWHKFKA